MSTLTARPLSKLPGDTGETGPVVRLPIGALRCGKSVRVSGENADHVRRLAGVAEATLPPIVVHQDTMRVIDGVHRLRAAQLRGGSLITARFLDCDELDAFVFALLANTERGGLPLTRADRRSAAEHILSHRPLWSDRRITAATGVATRTVAELRARLGGRTEARVGKDGRTRPTDGARRRERVRALLLDQPYLSLREAARAVGVSPETVRAVRAGLHADTAQTGAPRVITDVERAGTRAAAQQRDCATLFEWLRNDPALRSSQRGRVLLRLLRLQLELRTSLTGITPHVPSHCHDSLAAFARQNAVSWRAIAELIEHAAAS